MQDVLFDLGGGDIKFRNVFFLTLYILFVTAVNNQYINNH